MKYIVGKLTTLWLVLTQLIAETRSIQTQKATSTNWLSHANGIISNDDQPSNSILSLNPTAYFKSNQIHHINVTDEVVDSLVQDVLCQFAKVGADLQDITILFDTFANGHLFYLKSNKSLPSRIIRSPLTKRVQCTLSIDKLSDLKHSIVNALNGTTTTSSSKCNIASNSKDCDELIKFIQCGIDQLTKMIEANKKTATLTDLTKWKNYFESIHRKLLSFDENIKTVNQETRMKIDKLQTDCQKLQYKIYVSNDTLKDRLIKSEIIICASDIDIGKIEQAINTFVELKTGRWIDDYLISAIIEKAYSYFAYHNHTKTIDHIADFVWSLPTTSHQITGYKRLFYEMDKNEYVAGPETLTLAKKLRERIKPLSSSDLEMYIFTGLKDKETVVIKRWGNDIRNGNYQKILIYVQISDITMKNVCDNLPAIIENAYSNNLKNFENTLMFVNYLPEFRFKGFEELLNQMFRNGHLNNPQLLRWTYRLLCFKPCSKLSNLTISLVNLLFKETIVINGMLSLLFSAFVRIKSVQTGNNLMNLLPYSLYPIFFAFIPNYQPGHIFTYEVKSDGQKWSVDVLDDGRYFRFKCNGQALHAEDDKVTVRGRKIQQNDKRQQWEVIPVKNGEYFYLKNRLHGVILEADRTNNTIKSVHSVRVARSYSGNNHQLWTFSKF